MMFSSVETIRPDEGMRAAAKLAQGDYEGAIAEHEKNLEANPEQTHPAVEIARICTSKLQDPHRALSVLLQHLASREWPEDDAAFLRFRIADVHLEPLHDFDGARRQLEQVIADFPNTRHSANAQHRLHEIEQEEYKFIMEQRRKSAGQQAS
jgi:tetratricopeptide (TPR) repeat protein